MSGIVVFSNVLDKKKGLFLGFPDTIDRDLHFSGLKVKPMLVALFSMSVMSF